MGKIEAQVFWGFLLGCLLLGCKPTSEHDELQDEIRSGDTRALIRVQRLNDPESQVALIPALIDAYNDGLNRADIVGLLVEVGHESAQPVFVDALEDEDPSIAGLAARGLASIGAADQVEAMVVRMRDIPPSRYEPFLSALREFPNHPEVAPVISGILMRRVGQIGGIDTVRNGCSILGQSGASDSDTIQALLFSLINFVPQPYQDARLECQLALIRVGSPAVAALLAMFRGHDMTVNSHLQSMNYPIDIARTRAAWTLAEMASPEALDTMLEWLGTEQVLPLAELNEMPVEEQQNWFMHYGQSFEQVCVYLGEVGSAAEGDLAHEALRGLVVRGEGMLLENFSQAFALGELAEHSLRLAAIEGLIRIGDPNDRDLLYEIGVAGDLTRGPDILIRQAGAYGFAHIAQPDDAERFQELLNAIENAELREAVESYQVMVTLAEECQNEVDCLASHLEDEDMWIREKAVHSLAHYAENPTAAAAALLDHIDHANINFRLTIVSALKLLPLPNTAAEQINAAMEASSGNQWRDFRHSLRVLMAQRLD